MGKQQYISELHEGHKVSDVFQVKSSRLAETRAGKPYLLLELADKSGEISGPVWENAQKIADYCQVGDFVHARGQVQSFRDKLQLRIEDIAAVSIENVSLRDFVAASEYDLDDMAKELHRIIASVENSWIKKLLIRFFKNGQSLEKFQQAPAAKGIHHAYVGGLIEHCLSMARLADFAAGHYRGVDRSILLAGVLLHDIGKLQELEENVGVVDYTAPGRLKGHLVIGSEMVAEKAGEIKDFPEELLVQVQHLILSHHGRLEFGSPTLPMTPEAFLLSYLDDLDSKMNLIEQLRRKQKGTEMQWTDYQRSLERFLYLAPLPHEETAREVDEQERAAARQKMLF